jgi:hypothetical protein
MSKHTPGPWVMSVGDDPDDHPNWFPVIVSESYEVVGTEGFYGGDREMDIANARLAAAAPDLLEVAEELTALVGRILASQDWGAIEEYYDNGRAAIAKAKGEA